MGRRTLVELLHVVTGVVAASAIFAAAEWAYPLARATFDWLRWVTMAAIVAMGVPELRKAWLADRGRHG